MRTAFVGLLLALSVLLGSAGSLQAAELLMFEEPGCVWCRRWHAEVGPGYPRSSEGRLAPLRRIHISSQDFSGVLLDRRITATPTFVLVDEGREIGRITGYPGSDFFYGLLDELLRRLPRIPERQLPSQDRASASGAAATLLR